jgi:hypothetical protein
MRKGQVTVFMLIGIVMLLLVMSLIFMTTDLGNIIFPKDIVKDHVELCMTDALECTLFNIGANNGNIEFNQRLPLLDELETSSEAYFSNYVQKCENFSQLKATNISAGDIQASLAFNQYEVLAEMTQPIDVKQAEQRRYYDKFYAKVPVRLKAAYDAAVNIIGHNLTVIDKDFINTKYMEDYEIKVYENNPDIVTIIDQDSVLGTDLFRFSFIK